MFTYLTLTSSMRVGLRNLPKVQKVMSGLWPALQVTPVDEIRVKSVVITWSALLTRIYRNLSYSTLIPKTDVRFKTPNNLLGKVCAKFFDYSSTSEVLKDEKCPNFSLLNMFTLAGRPHSISLKKIGVSWNHTIPRILFLGSSRLKVAIWEAG